MREDPFTSFSTYSIVARDEGTGQFGVAVQTHQMCVGVAVPWLSPGVGALATQAMTNVRFGPMGLALLSEGLPAAKVLDALLATDEGAKSRQLAVVDRAGGVAAWTGEQCIPIADHRYGQGFSVQANMMVHPGVVDAMAEAYTMTKEDFAGRLMAALEAAQGKGGDIRGMQSAALKIVPAEAHDKKGLSQILPRYDLRVDEHDQPLMELARLVELRRATLQSQQGFDLLEEGKQGEALALWEKARLMAPEMEELAFWQSVTLADDHKEYDQAADILRPILEKQVNRADWVELIRRLQGCGILETEGTAEALIQALER